MSTSVAPLPWLIPLPGERQSPAPTDEDDGIHIVSVTPVDRPAGPALLVVVEFVFIVIIEKRLWAPLLPILGFQHVSPRRSQLVFKRMPGGA